MSERSPELGGAGFEIPEQSEGLERSLEKAFEAPVAPDVASARQTPASQAVGPTPTTDATSSTQSVAVDAAPTDDSLPVATTKKENHSLDKMWVERARSLISSTRDDPRTQKSKLAQIKADYLKARFNKLIKVEEAS